MQPTLDYTLKHQLSDDLTVELSPVVRFNPRETSFIDRLLHDVLAPVIERHKEKYETKRRDLFLRS